MYYIIKNMLVFILLSAFLSASDNNDSNVSKDTIFSLNGKLYKEKDFPSEYISLSKKKKSAFISEFIYYSLLSKSLVKESKVYQSKIQEAINKRDKDLRKKGIVLSELERVVLDKKIVTDTIGYNEILKKHKNINREIKEFYKKNKEGYKLPNRVEISHIVVKDKNLSKKIIEELNTTNDLTLFSKYARKYSIDKKTKYNGGYIGYTSKNQVDKVFFDTIWNSKEQSLVSKPLKQKDYFHIIYLFKKYKAEQKKLEDEKESIQDYLLKMEIRAWERSKILKLKKESKIIFYQ